MITQAVIAAVLTACTLLAWKAITDLAAARHRRITAVDADAGAIVAGDSAAPDPTAERVRSRQRHEELVAQLRQPR